MQQQNKRTHASNYVARKGYKKPKVRRNERTKRKEERKRKKKLMIHNLYFLFPHTRCHINITS